MILGYGCSLTSLYGSFVRITPYVVCHIIVFLVDSVHIVGVRHNGKHHSVGDLVDGGDTSPDVIAFGAVEKTEDIYVESFARFIFAVQADSFETCTH